MELGRDLEHGPNCRSINCYWRGQECVAGDASNPRRRIGQGFHEELTAGLRVEPGKGAKRGYTDPGGRVARHLERQGCIPSATGLSKAEETRGEMPGRTSGGDLPPVFLSAIDGKIATQIELAGFTHGRAGIVETTEQIRSGRRCWLLAINLERQHPDRRERIAAQLLGQRGERLSRDPLTSQSRRV